jgi:1-deoxy-D-xylulose-5-phosphate synthase
MLFTSLASEGPVAIRYPRGKGVGVPLDSEFRHIPTGEAEILTEGKDLLILAIGSQVHPCLEAAGTLEEEGHSVSVVNCRFIKPLDPRLPEIAARIGRVLIVEENTLKGGFGSAVLECFSDHDLPPVRIKRLGLPDVFVEHGPQNLLREKCGIGRKEIVGGARKLLTHHGSAQKKA